MKLGPLGPYLIFPEGKLLTYRDCDGGAIASWLSVLPRFETNDRGPLMYTASPGEPLLCADKASSSGLGDSRALSFRLVSWITSCLCSMAGRRALLRLLLLVTYISALSTSGGTSVKVLDNSRLSPDLDMYMRKLHGAFTHKSFTHSDSPHFV